MPPMRLDLSRLWQSYDNRAPVRPFRHWAHELSQVRKCELLSIDVNLELSERRSLQQSKAVNPCSVEQGAEAHDRFSVDLRNLRFMSHCQQ